MDSALAAQDAVMAGHFIACNSTIRLQERARGLGVRTEEGS
jgi:hypothetical protein